MAGALLGADRSASNWQLLLEGGGILLTEDTAAKTLVEGLNEKETEAGITLSIDPSTAYATIFAPMDKNFCTKFDQAIAELAPNFLDSNDEPFAGDLEVLANLVGDEQVVTYQSDGSPLEPYSVSISSAYITQRLAMLNLFVTPAMDIYSMPCIVKSAKVILPTEAYAEDQTGTWASQDVTVATMSNDVVTVVSDGACSFTFTGSDPTNSGSITAYCLLEPDVNVVKNCAAAKPYSSTDTTYGVTIQMSNQGVLTLNGTMTQNAEFTVSPLANGHQVPTYFDCSDIEGNLLLWCEELGGSCTVPSGRVYIDFCSKHPSSSNITVSEYQLELYSTLQIAQHTHAKLIHNDTKNIYGIRIFASSGTVFNNYQIRIGIKKYPTNGQVYNFGLLEPYMLAPNTFAQYMGNGPHTRVCDGSFSFFGLNTAAAVYRYSHSYTSTNSGPATIVTGDRITEIGKAYRFTVQIVEKPENITTMFKNAPAYFNLYYSDGTIAATINLTSEDQFRNDIASTSFISEKVVDFLGLATIKDATMQGRFRVAFNLEEISIDDLDLESLTLYTDSKIVNQQDIKVVYEPAAIIGSPTASALTWSSSNDEIATVDENGHITIHSDGECTFTATSVKTPSISASVTAMCYYAQDDNMVANLVKISQKTYSQGGITVKHNADGTITFNGTTTNSDNSYYRNVIWPLGNSKTVWNVFFPRQGISGTWLLWWEYVSGSIEGTSTFTGGSVSHELYVINHNGTEILKIQAKYTSPDDTDREKYCKSMTTSDGIRLVSWGFQMKKGTKFNNYTVKVGIKKFANLNYHGGVLEEFLCALTGYKKFDANKNTIWTRFPDGSIGGYLDESITAFPSASGYVRLTKELDYANNVNSILTGDNIGIAGHNYKLDVNLIKFKYDRIAATELKFGVAYANGTPAGEITIIDPATFVSSGTNIDLSGTTYSTVFQATEQLDCAYQYFNQLKVKGKEEYFAISLSDLDTMIIAYGQVITVTGNSTNPDDITVNYGGRLNVNSGTVLPKVTENGGYVYISDATVTFAPNTITDLEITGKNSTTVHSGTVLESSIINGNSAFVDVSSGGSCVDTTITSGGRMYVYGDGIASNIEVNEGSLSVNARADVFDITLNSGAALVVSNYGTVSNVVVNPGASLTGDHGSYYSITENGGYFSLLDNQNITTSVIVPNHVSGVSTDKYTVHSGTTLTDITGNSGYVYNFGIVNSTTLHYRNELTVSSGGTALNIVENGGSFRPEEGAVYAIASNTITGSIGSGCWNGITVHSNTIVSDATIVDDKLDVYSSGIVDNVSLISSAKLLINSGAIANNVSAQDGTGEIFVGLDGYVSNVRLSSGGYIEVSSGGTALAVENTPFTALVFSHAGASVTYTSNLSGVYFGYEGQIADQIAGVSDYALPVNKRLEIYSGGNVDIANIRDGGYVQVNSGGSIRRLRFTDDRVANIMAGGSAYDTTIATGMVYVRDGAVADSVTITKSSGYGLVVSSGGTLKGFVNVGSGASALVRSGAILDYNLVGLTPVNTTSTRYSNNGTIDIDDSPTCTLHFTSANSKGSYKLAWPGSQFSQYPVTVYKDGVSACVLTLGNSVVCEDREITLEIDNATSRLMFILDNYSIPISGTIINNGQTITVLPDERYIDTTINSGGSMYVSSMGRITSTVVNYGGSLTLGSNAHSHAKLIVENGGYVNTGFNNNNYAGDATFVPNVFSELTIESNYATVHSGTTATDIIVNNAGKLEVKYSGIASNVVVNPCGHLSVFISGSAINVTENGGNVSAHESALVNYIPNTFSGLSVGNCTMHSGTTGIDIGGSNVDIMVHSGGVLSTGRINHGGILILSGGYGYDLNATNYGGVTISAGGSAVNVSATGTAASIRVYGCASNVALRTIYDWGAGILVLGGTITGSMVCTNQYKGFDVQSGGAINFDLTSLVPDNSRLLSPISMVSGTPIYTLTMPDEELSSGVYNLADGVTSEGFHDYIHLQDTSGVELDHVAVGVDYASASARYALDVIDDTSLVLSKGEWDLIVDNNSKVTISGGSYVNVLVRLGDLSCLYTTIDNLQVLYGGYVTNGQNTTISNCAEHGGNIEPGVASKVKHFTPNYVSGLEMISGKNIQLHSGTTLFGITGANSNYVRVFSGASVVNPVIQNFKEFTVNPSGVIINPTVPQGNSFTIVSGGTALHVSTAYLERVAISNGAYIEWINEEGNLIVVSSGVSNIDTDMTSAEYLVIQSGTLNATSGAILSNVTVFGANNVVNVLSNASASCIDLNRGTATISQGVVDSITLYSGVVNIADGAIISKIGNSNYTNNGRVNISSGAIYDGGNSCVGKYNTVTVYSGGSFVNASGIALSIDGKSGCYISHVMPQVGRIRVTVAPNTYINAYYTYGWRTMENAYFSGHVLSNTGGGLDSVTILSGGSAEDITMTGGAITVSAGGILTYPIMSGGTLTVMSGGSAVNVDSQGGSVVSANGAYIRYINFITISTEEDVTITESATSSYWIESNGRLYVSSGGIAENTKCDYGTICVYSGGSVSNTTMNGGSLIVSGGEASDTTVIRSGYIYCYDGVVNGLVTSNRAGIYIRDTGVVNNVVINSSTDSYGSGYMYVSSGGTANNVTIIDGYTSVLNGGVVSDIALSAGARLTVASGGTALNISCDPIGGEVTVENGAYVTYANAESPTGVYFGTGTIQSQANSMSNKNVISGGKMVVFDSGIAVSTGVNRGGSMYVQSGGTADYTTVSGYVFSPGSGKICVSNGGVISHTTVNSYGYVYLSSGASANTVTANYGGFYVYAGASVENVTVNPAGRVYVYSNGTATSVTVTSGGNLTISSGGTAVAVKENLGIVRIEEGAVVDFAPNTLTNRVVSSRISATIHSSTILTSATIDAYGQVSVYQGGQVNNTIVNGGLFISSGGTASNLAVSTGGITIHEGGIVTSATINPYGKLTVNSGGTADAILENGGCINVAEEANITFIPNTLSSVIISSGVSATIHAQTIISDVIINPYGSLIIHDGGSCINAEFNSGGYIEVSSGGTALNVNSTPWGGGRVESRIGAYVTFVSQFSGVQYFSSGELCSSDSLENITLTSTDVTALYICDNGSASNVSMDAGTLYVGSDGIVNGVYASNPGKGASMQIAGSATDLTLGGLNRQFTVDVTVKQGATVDNVIVNANVRVTIEDNATVTSVVENGGYVSVAPDASVTFIPNVISSLDQVDDWGYGVTIHSGTTLTSVTTSRGISVYILGGTVENAQLANTYLSGACVTSVTFNTYNNGGISMVNTIGNSLVFAGMTDLSMFGGSITNLRINSGLITRDGAYVENVYIGPGYNHNLRDGIVSNAVLSSTVTELAAGGSMIDVTLDSSGYLYVYGSGMTSNVTINKGGILALYPNAIADGVTINSRGTLVVSSGATALNVVKNSGGMVTVESGGSITYV